MEATIFDSMMRGEWAKAMDAAYPPALAEVSRFLQILTATQRRERQTWMSPAPGASKYTGERHFAMLDHSLSEVEMEEYDSGFRVLNRDIKDSNIALWKNKPAEMVARVRQYRTEQALAYIKNAKTYVSFEGSSSQYQAASTHTVGTGDNLIGTTCAGGSALNIVAMYVGGAVKPFIWYDREAPKLDSDAGTKMSSKNKYTDHWVDGEGAVAPGFWWDFIYNDLTGTPTAAEFKTMLNEFQTAFRSFTYPDGKYIHQYTQFDKNTLLLAVPPAIEGIAEQVRDESMISLTSNRWVNRFDFIVTHELD